MKPLLKSAPLTFLDSTIWLHVAARFSLDYPLRLDLVSGDVDRRDAALMLHTQQIASFGPAAIELYGIPCRGWNEHGYWIEDTDDGEGVWCRY